jgi:hypothetical protein
MNTRALLLSSNTLTALSNAVRAREFPAVGAIFIFWRASRAAQAMGMDTVL